MIVRHDMTMVMLAAMGIKKVVGGWGYTMVLLNNGELWGCGRGQYGQLGNGSTTTNNPSFVKATTVPAGRTVVTLACGYFHTMVILDNGELWGCGYGQYGQLGNGSTTTNNPSFAKATTVPAGRTVVAVACGAYHTMAILDNGELWGCGGGGATRNKGQLGRGSTTDSTSFVKATTVPAGRTVVAVACGAYHTMAILDNGELWGCGSGYRGALGKGNSTDATSFVKATTVPAGRTVVALACGEECTIVLLDNGELWGCGDGTSGQLGNGSTSPGEWSFVKATTVPAGRTVVALACSGLHTMVILDNGELWGCGYGQYGQLENGSTTTNNPSFVKATTVPAGRTVVAVARCRLHTMVILDNGALWGCGDGQYGQLGNGSTTTNNPSFVKATLTWEEAA